MYFVITNHAPILSWTAWDSIHASSVYCSYKGMLISGYLLGTKPRKHAVLCCATKNQVLGFSSRTCRSLRGTISSICASCTRHPKKSDSSTAFGTCPYHCRIEIIRCVIKLLRLLRVSWGLLLVPYIVDKSVSTVHYIDDTIAQPSQNIHCINPYAVTT